METTTIIQRKRKADQREQQTSSTTKSHHRHQHHHHHRHLRIEAPKFIGVSEATTITTTSPPSSREEEVHVALLSAPPSRPVTPREMQVDDRPPPPSPAVGLRPTTPSPSPSPAAAEEAAGGGGVEGEDGAATTTTTTAEEEASLASLPVELFCSVVAYLGPTSSSLCALCRVSRHHNAVMTSIGDVMLRRARLRFRVPLPPRTSGGAIGGGDDGRGVATTTIVESSVSLFVRHARVSKAVHDRLEGLVGTMRRGGPPVPPPPPPLLRSRRRRVVVAVFVARSVGRRVAVRRARRVRARRADGAGFRSRRPSRSRRRAVRRRRRRRLLDDDRRRAVGGAARPRRRPVPPRHAGSRLLRGRSRPRAPHREPIVDHRPRAEGARRVRRGRRAVVQVRQVEDVPTARGGGWGWGWAQGPSCTRTMPSRIG